MTTSQHPGRFRFTLTHQILLGLVIGCLIGWLSPSFATSLKPISTVFLRMIRMIIGPLILTTLVAGIAGIAAKAVGRLGLKAIGWFLLATTVALLLGLATANLVAPGAGIHLPDARAATELGKTKGLLDFLVEAFPVSIWDAMARNDVLQVVVASIFLGLAVSAVGAKAQAVKDLAEAGAETMFKVTGFVMRFAPFGVGAAIAVMLGTSGTSVLLPLLKCIVALYAALIVFFILLFTALKLLTRTNIPTFLYAIREPAMIAFTTASSDAALPRAMQVLQQLGIPRRIVSFVVPTGYALNLDGTMLYLSLALLFVAQAGGLDMTLGQQLGAMLVLMLQSKGVAGVPRAALVVLYGVVLSMHLSEQAFALILGVDALMDMGRTCVNVVGNCVATVIVGVWEKAIPDDAPIFHPRASGRAAELPTAELLGERAGSDKAS